MFAVSFHRKAARLLLGGQFACFPWENLTPPGARIGLAWLARQRRRWGPEELPHAAA